MKQLLIIGTGQFAREVYWHAQNSLGYGDEFTIKGFLDGRSPIDEAACSLLPLPCLGTIQAHEIEHDEVFCIAIANSRVKEELNGVVRQKNGSFIDLIHKTAMVSPLAEIGTGFICAQFTTVSCNTKIGDFVILNGYSGIGHDASIGDYTSIMSHVDITGGVTVGKRTYWGSGSRALPHSKIGDDAKVGAGSVVLKKVRPGKTVFGVPAVEID